MLMAAPTIWEIMESFGNDVQATLDAAESGETPNSQYMEVTWQSYWNDSLLSLSIRVTEYRPFLTGLSRCGQRLNGDHDVRFVWSVVVRGQRVLRFRCGASVPGERLLDVARREDLECLLRLCAPAHTVLIIGYEE